MQTQTSRFVILVTCLMGSLFYSCKKEDDNGLSVSSAITDGTWRVSYYMDHSQNETSDFSGMTFVFLQNGQLTINQASGSSQGIWSISGSDDHPESQKLVLYTGTTEPLKSLNDDWQINSFTSTQIDLIDDSHINEALRFTKM